MVSSPKLSIDSFPVTGLENASLMRVFEANRALLATRKLIALLRNSPDGLPWGLKQALDNINFHVVGGLSMIDSYLTIGHSPYEMATNVPGLLRAIDSHLWQIKQAKRTWTKISNDEFVFVDVDSALVPVSASLTQVVPEMTAMQKALADNTEALKPDSLSYYLGFGLAAAGLWLAYRVLK